MFQDPGSTRLLAISPHLDDAVLSIGAGLAQAAQDGAEVTVYTVFAGTAPPPYSSAAERMHAVWGLSPDEDAPLFRRKEDIAALDHLGLEHRHGRFLDSIYRRLPDGQWLADHLEGGPKIAINRRAPADDPDLVAEIGEDIRSVIEECRPTLLVTCAAVLDHPDNQATRDAALFAAREQNIPVRLWEDLPYAIFRPGAVELPPGFVLGPPEFSPATEELRVRKFDAVAFYASQLAMFRGRDDNDTFGRLDAHARKTSADGGYGETTWPVLVS
ncbi:PIG-L deacetylase family protein [Umezawaea endophytica]|uniref:PIG-L family deacetylase n=2 Tax=Umezawaea endophytica TaxID=1654476 RepID=A0A9X3A1C3_9PSEU|nr:PIG-L family deacetylase [Umezawaea endophytica]MCS7477853.1 PIG-L family deacetylase [Umezawaea endophytica]